MSTVHRSRFTVHQGYREEHLFRYPLAKPPAVGTGSVNDLLAGHLQEILRLLVPTAKGQELSLDGYVLLSERGTVRALGRGREEPCDGETDPLVIYEPRIGYIRRMLESLLGVVELEADGKPVRPDGFRLRDPGQWLVSGVGANEILAQAATRCNLNCRFCYNRGVPPVLRPRPRDPGEEWDEIRTRIERHVPSGRLGLFPDMGSPCEVLAHPQALSILEALREKTAEPLRIPSNGSTLDRGTIRALGGLRPVSVDVSLNSASPERRRWLMGDPNPQVALQSLGRLRAAGIPYSVVIVPWPFPSREAMLEDLARTVSFAAARDPTLIQVSLPGYTRFFSAEEVFPHEEVWGEIRTAVRELRPAVPCPIVLRPGLFEEHPDPERVNTPEVSGVVRGSPADRAGLRKGDRLIRVNGIPVKNRAQARSLLTVLHRSDLQGSSVQVERSGESVGLRLDHGDFDYPYSPDTATHLGVVFASSGVPEEWCESLRRVIASRGAREVLVFTSQLVKPALEHSLHRGRLPRGVRLHLRVPANRFFGGNILLGDLLVVQDFIDAVEEFVAAGGSPDLAAVPSSPFHLSRWGRDLQGREYLEIERRTGVPVALVECDPIFD
jgi:hypothetical protein